MNNSLQEKDASIVVFQNIGLSFEARSAYYKFIRAVANKDVTSSGCERIYSIIDNIVLNDEVGNQFRETIPSGTILYRARIVDPEKDHDGKGISRNNNRYTGFDELNSREPILGIGGAGRNNYDGVSYLYVADEPQTACMEVKPIFADLISLAKFRVKKDLNVINFLSNKAFEHRLSEDCDINLAIFFTHLMFRYMEPVNKKEDYYATQIISDHIRKTGMDGIIYGSFLVPNGKNYTIFNSHKKNIEFVESKLVTCRQADYCFWDLNENAEIHSNPEHSGMDYNERDVDGVKRNLNTWIKDENGKR